MTDPLTPEFLAAREAYLRAQTEEERLELLYKMQDELNAVVLDIERERIERMIPPIMKQANAAFLRDLPQLLRERPGQYVAYRGEKLLGFSKDSRALFARCVRDGAPDEEILIQYVAPYNPDAVATLGGIY